MAINAMCQITSNYEEYSRLTTDLKNQLDWQASMVGAKREGRAEGFSEGREEGLSKGREEGLSKGREEGLSKGRAETSLEIARKMKEMGDSIEKIQAITGLPPETIERM